MNERSGAPGDWRYDRRQLEAIADNFIDGDNLRTMSMAVSSRADIITELHAIAMEFRRNLSGASNNTTLKKERARLDAIAATARKLQTLIRGDGNAHGLMQLTANQAALFRQGKDGSYEHIHDAEVIERPLRALLEAAGQAKGYLDANARSGGGQGGLHVRLHGEPAVRLAAQCALLLIEYRGEGQAPIRKDGGGPVADLFRKLWEFAIGEPPSEEQLLHAVEAGARSARDERWLAAYYRDRRGPFG